MRYELTEETMRVKGYTPHRLRYVKSGRLGGFPAAFNFIDKMTIGLEG